MAKVLLNTENKTTLLEDWFLSDINRANELFFNTEEINPKELIAFCFLNKTLIKIESVDQSISKITFVDTLI